MPLNSVENNDCWHEGDGGGVLKGSLLLGKGVKNFPTYNIRCLVNVLLCRWCLMVVLGKMLAPRMVGVNVGVEEGYPTPYIKVKPWKRLGSKTC